MSIFASQYAKKYSIDNKLVRAAQENIYNGEVKLVGFSGKICSGKDTVAENYLKSLRTDEKGSTFFADYLKIEIGEIMDLIREEYDNTPSLKRMVKAYAKTSISRISKDMGVSEEEAKIVYDLLNEDALTSDSANGYTRTPGIRSATQKWATEIRRGQNPLYWVQRTAKDFTQMLADGTHTVVTDVRFPNEAQSILDLGGIVVRLDVSLAEQQRRLLVRDGIGISKDQLMHPSEISLDEYTKFTVRVNTDQKAPKDVMTEVLERLSSTPIDEKLTASGEAEHEAHEVVLVADEPKKDEKPETNPEEFGLKTRPISTTQNSSKEPTKFPTSSPFKKEPEVYSGPKKTFPTKSPFKRGW